MKFVVGLDYELFFGARTGSPYQCMLDPTWRIVEVLDRHQCVLTLFVDAAYLCRLRESGCAELIQQHDAICQQLKSLSKAGHDVQLHVHSHWEDSEYISGAWHLKTTRYRLHDFDPLDRLRLAKRYVDELDSITGVRPVAYRAGGWCLQPFSHIADALADAGIDVDSTVYAGGFSNNPGREFDFKGAPTKDVWRFNDDPLFVEPRGRFVEVPISAFSLLPMHYWKTVLSRVVGSKEREHLGDGVALANSRSYYLRKLLLPENAVVSVDGSRVDYLHRAWQGYAERNAALFNVMGHPKSLTDHSLNVLDGFLQNHRHSLEPVALSTFSGWQSAN